MSKDLLSEAIADAKAIREVALENAKASIAETFAPQIKSMISTRLQEEESVEDSEDMDEGFMFEEDDEMDSMDEADDYMEEGEDMDPMDEADDMEDMEEGEDMNLDEIIAELEEQLAEAEEGDEEPIEEAEEGDEEEVTRESVEAYINELLSEMEDEDLKEAEKSDDDKEEIEELKDELEEAYKTVKFLKKKINEVSLINSKLLYSGRIFRAHTLNEQQKITILESFDRATTIRETKLLYATISSTLKESRNTGKVSGKKSRLKESRASKSTGSTKSTKVLQENRMVSRLQHLAGII